MKGIAKKIVLRLLGRAIRDADSGAILGRGLIYFWLGRLLIYGYQGPPLRVSFETEVPFSYNRRILVFRIAQIPDFPRIVSHEK